MSTPALILVIDDEPSFQEIFSTKLGAAGFKVETAEDGVKGIEQAENLKPDLILLDMKMPGMNGAEVLAKLKENPATKDIKVAFLTNYGETNPQKQGIDEQFAKEAGAMAYIRKTEDLNKLVEDVKALLK